MPLHSQAISVFGTYATGALLIAVFLMWLGMMLLVKVIR
jgi:hypothetical protein